MSDRLRQSWRNMHRRCEDPDCENYPLYGGRGISVCPGWERFGPFREWALSNGYRDDLTIDRIDNDGDYTPTNCRWATMETQANNRSTCVELTYQGRTQTLAQWARELGISYHTLYRMVVRLGWPIERALQECTRKYVRKQDDPRP